MYCFEPSLIADPNYDQRHWGFAHESLTDLQQQLANLPSPPVPQSEVGPLVHEWLPFTFDDALEDSPPQTGPPALWVFHREVIDVLTALQTQFTIGTIFSHQETGLALTYTRDKAVVHFCRQQGIGWHEYQSNGVIRALKNRETWSANWLQTMQAPQQHPDFTRWYPAPMPANWYEDQRGPDLSSAWLVPTPHFTRGRT